MMALSRCVAAAVFAAAASLGGVPAFAQHAADDSIRGVVTGPNGPEPGVWVIAETTYLPTKYAKVVVTDDEGRMPSRSSESEVQRVVARLRPEGLRQDRVCRARP
jgi:hypothetical protein